MPERINSMATRKKTKAVNTRNTETPRQKIYKTWVTREGNIRKLQKLPRVKKLESLLVIAEKLGRTKAVDKISQILLKEYLLVDDLEKINFLEENRGNLFTKNAFVNILKDPKLELNNATKELIVKYHIKEIPKLKYMWWVEKIKSEKDFIKQTNDFMFLIENLKNDFTDIRSFEEYKLYNILREDILLDDKKTHAFLDILYKLKINYSSKKYNNFVDKINSYIKEFYSNIKQNKDVKVRDKLQTKLNILYTHFHIYPFDINKNVKELYELFAGQKHFRGAENLKCKICAEALKTDFAYLW